MCRNVVHVYVFVGVCVRMCSGCPEYSLNLTPATMQRHLWDTWHAKRHGANRKFIELGVFLQGP